MTEEREADWPERQAKVIGERVKTLRESSGMRVQEVADICTNELGYRLNRTSLNNLEAGLRKSVNVAEIAAIATAIGAAPLSLLMDLSTANEVEIVGGTRLPAWEAWQWWGGEYAVDIIAGQDNEQAKRTGEIVGLMRTIDESVRSYRKFSDQDGFAGAAERMKANSMNAVFAAQTLEAVHGVVHRIPTEVKREGERHIDGLRDIGLMIEPSAGGMTVGISDDFKGRVYTEGEDGDDE
ncbi:MAG: hypothetical protein ACTIID_12875 [Brevibacterium linens]|uniref:hypothetical protein n=1 Tax=Brevibacterium linens TaxID=1703 RepID=UPI003F97D84B